MVIGRIRKKYEAIRSEYLSRSPRGKWEFVRNIGIFVLTLTGVPVLDPEYEVFWYSYAPGLTCMDIFISYFWTIYYYIDTPIQGILVTPLLGVVIPSAVCYLLVMIPSKKLGYQSLAFFAGDKIYTRDGECSNEGYIQVCDESAVKLLKSTSTTLGIVVTSMIILLIFPVYAFVFRDDIQLPIPVILLFTGMDTKDGITINMVNQVFMVLIGGTGNIGIEIITCILKNNVWACTVAICHSIDEISQVLEYPEGDIKRYVDFKLRNILVQVQDLDRFILKLSDLYYWKFFLQPALLTASVAIAIFFYMYADWTSGLGTAFLTYSQLYILCDIGNEVDSANKMLVLKFLQMPWYLMSRQNQLDYAHMLNRLQNGAILRMGPFAELNFETFSNMTNKIYSTLMMLVRFTK